MLTQYFLKQVGITKAQFTKFVKSSDEDVDERLSSFGNDAYPGEAHSCCGVAELSGLSGATQDRINEVVAAALTEFNFAIYYSNDRPTTRKFQKIGFEVVHSFRNPNTGHQIDVCILKTN